MNILKSKIDYNSLEKELHQALKDDELYQLQNDAKIRAVEQNVPTYEDFRQIVNAAHLKPLENSNIEKKHEILWNPVYNLSKTNLAILPNEHTEIKSTRLVIDEILKEPPKNFKDFIYIWERLINFKEKFTFLYAIREALQKKIFHLEIPPFLFGDLINVCLEYETCISTIENIKSTTDILTILSNCNRFDLAVAFMTKHEKENCSLLFQRLTDKLEGYQDKTLQSLLLELSRKYNVM